MKYTIIIRFTSTKSSAKNLQDLKIPLSINFERDNVNRLINVTWLKATIRDRASDCGNKRLRLIYNGRVLNETTDFNRDIFEPKLKQLREAGEQVEEEKVYIHCVVGEELTAEQLSQENQLDNRPQQRTTAPEVIGFDRLLQQGFTQEDINDLRRQFVLIYGANLPSRRNDQISDLEEEENAQSAIRQLEERWIESTVNTNEQAASAPTANTEQPTNTEQQAPPQPLSDLDDARGNEDLLLGLLIGVFLGVLSLIFIVGDDTICNKRQKMSIVAGVVLNCMFAIVRGSWI